MDPLITMWGKHQVGLSWVSKNDIPQGATITSSHGICFIDDKHIVLVNIDTRGWDFPGGHLEGKESPEEAFHREAMEEACISGEATLLGYVAVDNRNDAFWDESLYPAIGYQAYYRMDVTGIHDFNTDFESSERKVFPISEVALVHNNWNHLLNMIVFCAIMSPM